jgi:hypothetical protein
MRHSAFRHFFLGIVVPLAITGCEVTRSAEYTRDPHSQQRATSAHKLAPHDGLTHRDDVLRIMGAPDAEAMDGRLILYVWTTYRDARFLVPDDSADDCDASSRYADDHGGGGDDDSDWLRFTVSPPKTVDMLHRYLVMQFDEQGVLVKHRRERRRRATIADVLEEWGVPPPAPAAAPPPAVEVKRNCPATSTTVPAEPSEATTDGYPPLPSLLRAAPVR